MVFSPSPPPPPPRSFLSNLQRKGESHRQTHKHTCINRHTHAQSHTQISRHSHTHIYTQWYAHLKTNFYHFMFYVCTPNLTFFFFCWTNVTQEQHVCELESSLGNWGKKEETLQIYFDTYVGQGDKHLTWEKRKALPYACPNLQTGTKKSSPETSTWHWARGLTLSQP